MQVQVRVKVKVIYIRVSFCIFYQNMLFQTSFLEPDSPFQPRNFNTNGGTTILPSLPSSMVNLSDVAIKGNLINFYYIKLNFIEFFYLVKKISLFHFKFCNIMCDCISNKAPLVARTLLTLKIC